MRDPLELLSGAKRYQAPEGGARVLRAGKGYGRACLAGALAANEACGIIVTMDGDGSDVPEEIPKLIAPIAAGVCDFVIASRSRGGRELGSMAWHQLASGWLIGGSRHAYGFRYTDMCAFRAISGTLSWHSDTHAD